MRSPIGVTVELFHIGNVFVVGVIGASESNLNTIILCLMVKQMQLFSLVELTVWTGRPCSYEMVSKMDFCHPRFCLFQCPSPLIDGCLYASCSCF